MSKKEVIHNDDAVDTKKVKKTTTKVEKIDTVESNKDVSKEAKELVTSIAPENALRGEKPIFSVAGTNVDLKPITLDEIKERFQNSDETGLYDFVKEKVDNHLNSIGFRSPDRKTYRIFDVYGNETPNFSNKEKEEEYKNNFKLFIHETDSEIFILSSTSNFITTEVDDSLAKDGEGEPSWRKKSIILLINTDIVTTGTFYSSGRNLVVESYVEADYLSLTDCVIHNSVIDDTKRLNVFNGRIRKCTLRGNKDITINESIIDSVKLDHFLRLSITRSLLDNGTFSQYTHSRPSGRINLDIRDINLRNIPINFVNSESSRIFVRNDLKEIINCEIHHRADFGQFSSIQNVGFIRTNKDSILINSDIVFTQKDGLAIRNLLKDEKSPFLIRPLRTLDGQEEKREVKNELDLEDKLTRLYRYAFATRFPAERISYKELTGASKNIFDSLLAQIASRLNFYSEYRLLGGYEDKGSHSPRFYRNF